MAAFALLRCTPWVRGQEAEVRVVPTVEAGAGEAGGTLFGKEPDPRRTHRYYIAAEEESWDFAPTGRDEVHDRPLPRAVAGNRKGEKVRYVQYTDASFGTRVFPNPALGILGPVLRGVVGDFIAVTFLNRTMQPLSMHPHGVHYDKDSEGAYYQPAPGQGAAVAPGAKFTYVWELDESSGPLPDEPSSKAWLYHSHVRGDTETNLGLIGCIIVTDPRRARPDGTPRDVDREFATLFMIFDESALDEETKEAAEHAGPGAPAPTMNWSQVQQLLAAGARHAINGRIFGNLAGLEMNEGERTRWYLFALGSEQDLHTAHWHGLSVIEEGRRRTDAVELLPASMKVADLLADVPGTWLFHCHLAEHMREGMFARMIVHPRDGAGASRAAEAAFPGLPGAAQSMRIERAVRGPAGTGFTVAGVATMFDGFAVFTQPVRVQVGEKSAVFLPDRSGVARLPGAVFRFTNANASGVVRGDAIRFELVLTGADWLAGWAEAGLPAKKGAGRAVTFSLEIGQARHTALVSIEDRAEQP